MKKAKSKAKKALVKMTTTATVAVDADHLVSAARVHFGQMQKSWFYFAKSISLIKSTGGFLKFDPTFREFCEREYATVNYSTILKFIAIVDSWGTAIESRLKKDENYILPAYESFYQLTTVQGRVPEAELSRLRKEVLDSRLGYHSLRERLKEHLVAHRKKVSAEVESSTEDIEKELIADLEEEDGFVGDDSGELEDRLFVPPDEEEVDDEEEEENPVSVFTSRVSYLKDNLPVFQKELKKSKTLTDSTVELAKDLESLAETINEFLNTVEDLSQ